MDIDISNLSLEQFFDLLNRTTKLQNMADGGLSYIDPTIRELSGQKPLNIRKYEIPVRDEMHVDLEGMKAIAEKTPEHIAYVLRKSSDAKLLTVMHLPESVSSENPHIKKVSYGYLN